MASLYYQTVQIGKWNKASSKFIAFQKLKMHLPPSQVKFYNTDNQLYLSVLSGEHDTRITQYAYRGALGFVEQASVAMNIKTLNFKFKFLVFLHHNIELTMLAEISSQMQRMFFSNWQSAKYKTLFPNKHYLLH